MDRGKGAPVCCSVWAVRVWVCTCVCLCVSAGKRLTSFGYCCHYLAPALRDGVVRGGHSWSRGNSNDPQCSSLNQEVPIKTGWDHWRQQILPVTVTQHDLEGHRASDTGHMSRWKLHRHKWHRHKKAKRVHIHSTRFVVLKLLVKWIINHNF